MSMNRKTLRKYCEAKCKRYESTPDRTVYTGHKFVLDLLDQTEWIPVSERLPEGYCLFCDIDGDVYYGHIYDKKWWAEGQNDRIKNVTAWMPLPEPYKSESEEEK
jgi:hypothetical protein